MSGPSVLDQLGFTVWLIVLHAAVLIPVYGVVCAARRRLR